MENLIDIIKEYSLTVRCLPYIVKERFRCPPNYKPKEGEKIVESGEWPLISKEKKVEKGGWWYVKETPNTMSTVRFSRKYDKFFAPTLKEAIDLFLKSKNEKRE